MDNLEILKKQLKVVATMLFCLLVTVTAQAGAIVTKWNFDTWAEFSAGTFTGGTGTTIDSIYELSWGANGADYTDDSLGTGSSRSALTIGSGPAGDDRFGGGHATGSVDTILGAGPPSSPGEVGIGISTTHWNNTLSGSFASLTGGTLTDYLTLDAIVPNTGGVESAPTVAIDFKFQETSNSGTAGLCLDGSTAASHTGGCPDIFGFEADLTIGIPFLYDGNWYGIDVLVFDEFGGAAPIAALDAGYCSALGFAGACSGLVTPEKAHTTFQFGFDIRHIRSVPEPNSIALLAMAMIVFGAKKYRFNLKK